MGIAMKKFLMLTFATFFAACTLVIGDQNGSEFKRDNLAHSETCASGGTIYKYVMIEMVATKEESEDGINFRVDSDAWYVVRNTNGVTGFVGVGSDPIPMEDEEVENIFDVIGYGKEEEEKEIKEIIKINFEIGDYVELLEGGFEGQGGKVTEIDMEHQRVKVMVEMFGRMTPVEAEFNGVKKVD